MKKEGVNVIIAGKELERVLEVKGEREKKEKRPVSVVEVVREAIRAL